MREMVLNDNELKNINVYIWDNVESPKGIFQLVHGVNEHGMRYDEFARFLNTKGYIVYMHDHISQGKSRLKEEETVYFGKKGINNLIHGVELVFNQIIKDYDNLPVYAFGHSLGASILRIMLMKKNPGYKKAIINGTGLSSTKGLGLVTTYGGLLKLFGAKKPSKFFDNIFRQTQFKLREKVDMDHFIEWLTRDKEKTEINKKDEYLYISLSVSAFLDILNIFKVINNKTKIKETSKDIEYLIMSGTHDPATNFGMDAMKLNDEFNKIGLTSTLKLYPEGRHDTIQEINRHEVFTDILDFIK